MYSNSLRRVLIVIAIVLALGVGMYINSIFIRGDEKRESVVPIYGSKIDRIMNMINVSYVDTVDIKQIEEDAIRALIKDLDPHTVYIPAKDMVRTNEEMMGNFGGIGVQFYMFMDTVTVIRVISGGPSEKAGLEAGDRIVRVNDSLIAGEKVKDTDVMSLLRGKLGSKVDLTIHRRGEKQPLTKRITRGNIPVKSVDVAYLLNDTTGYIKVHMFGMNTYSEFIRSLEELTAKGMKELIIDLRNNEGGMLDRALTMVNEFLESDRLILYTKGKASPRSDYYSNGKGKYKNLPLKILINESSASASEIFAGAIQDNDRGVIIGRRSFGKGLVQEQRMLPDGSALRLTVSRYYIPSGRSIQRPYNEGKEKYYTDFYERILNGELEQKDSIHFDESQRYETVGGRTVYGGGGIMPDVFVPADTLGYSKYYLQLIRSSQLYNDTIDFMDKHRDEMGGLKDYNDVLKFLRKYPIVEQMVTYAQQHGVDKDNKGLKESYSHIKNQLEAYIARHLLDDEGYYPVIGKTDVTLQRALEVPAKVKTENQ